jgi:hypothetical protein
VLDRPTPSPWRRPPHSHLATVWRPHRVHQNRLSIHHCTRRARCVEPREQAALLRSNAYPAIRITGEAMRFFANGFRIGRRRKDSQRLADFRQDAQTPGPALLRNAYCVCTLSIVRAPWVQNPAGAPSRTRVIGRGDREFGAGGSRLIHCRPVKITGPQTAKRPGVTRPLLSVCRQGRYRLPTVLRFRLLAVLSYEPW